MNNNKYFALEWGSTNFGQFFAVAEEATAQNQRKEDVISELPGYQVVGSHDVALADRTMYDRAVEAYEALRESHMDPILCEQYARKGLYLDLRQDPCF